MSGLKFPNGAVRVTPLLHAKVPDALSFAEILDPTNLQAALLTSFTLDINWLEQHQINPDASLTLISQHIRYNDSADLARYTIVRPEFPSPHVQIMHSKLMLLFFPRFMRFVVSTANLVEDEWSIVHNCLFIQDFPLDRQHVFEANSFSMDLAHSLHDLSVPFSLIAGLNHVDFGRARVRIVCSVPSGNSRRNLNMRHYGMLRLASVLQANQLHGQHTKFAPNVRLYCTSSSLGKIDAGWLRDIYICSHGVDPQTVALSEREQMVPTDLIDVAMGFHTREDARANLYGPQASQYIMAKRSVYDEPWFAKAWLFKVFPQVENTLVHAKAIVARVGEEQNKGWMFIGSHNFTPAAWGRLNVQKPPYYNNYEFGVVLTDVEYTFHSMEHVTNITWSSQNISLPFKSIWQPYGRNDIPYFND
ncbi:hypothetical protein EV183_005377 [Coemansia sp. RSA 2336]|nr:hypothetical protein EV183_005377 [Coemansia sp. RSA 2336]